jgi:ketosteroid isomerase-like protein
MSQDADEIRAVVTDYLEGMIYGDAGQLARAFHPRAVAFGRYRGQLEHEGRDQFIPSWTTMGPLPRGTPYAAEVIATDIIGDIAVVRLTDTCFGDDFTDCLMLVRDMGRWQIMAKAFHVHEKGER